MTNKHLNLFFPEWQGYGEDNSVQTGATLLRDHLKSFDFQSIDVPQKEELPIAYEIMGYAANLRQLKHARNILEREQPVTTFMIGGTCASEIAPVSYLNELYDGNLAVLWFDAHGDLNTPHSSPSKHFHGMPLRTLLGDSNKQVLNETFSVIKPQQAYVLGGRDFDESEQVFIEKSGIHHFEPNDLLDPEVLIRSIKDAGFKNLYVHVDLDVLEPSEFPHMLLPIAEGVGVGTLLHTISKLKEHFKIVGSSIVEYVPNGQDDYLTIDKIIKALGH